MPKDENVLAVPAAEVTIAEALKTKGYHTIHLGKWHLGGVKGSRPEDQGFDESLGFMAGAALFAPVGDPGVVESRQDWDPIDKFLWGAAPFAVQFNGGKLFNPSHYMTDYLTDEAVKAIDANKNRPFFMYLAYNAVHTPLQAPKADYDALSHIKDHRMRVYAAMVRNLDRNVGKVLQALKDRGLDDNTLVIFTSDNGGANYIGLPDINKPYRGWKATFFEGGIKVPFLLRWPEQLPAGAVYRSPVGHVDIFATGRLRCRCAHTQGSGAGRRRPRAVREGTVLGRSAQGDLLAFGRLQDGARRRLEAAGGQGAKQDLAL